MPLYNRYFSRFRVDEEVTHVIKVGTIAVQVKS